MPGLLKRQIFIVLQDGLDRVEELRHKALMHDYIQPLYYLYEFCQKNGIEDLKHLTDKDVSGYIEYYKQFKGTAESFAKMIVFKTRKILFLHDKTPDFTATMWFTERFNLTLRDNPAKTIDSFYFGDISEKNRIYIQHYVKYLLVLSPKYSLPQIRALYIVAKSFTHHLENKGSRLTEISYRDIEEYVKEESTLEIQPATFNRHLSALSDFLSVMVLREKLQIPSFPFEYYYKQARRKHHDRSVPEDTIDRILTVLPNFPETIGLMFLTLYSTGLRVSEVCTMKKDSLITDGSTYWIKVYQHKLRSEKEIPIPEELYRLLRRRIDNDSSESEYVFQRHTDKSRPYTTIYFWQLMNHYLSLYEETKDIHFKSHDYRHTIATDLHTSGVPIAATRAFLGHTTEEMTKQYIDHLQGHIDVLQDEYLKENKLK